MSTEWESGLPRARPVDHAPSYENQFTLWKKPADLVGKSTLQRIFGLHVREDTTLTPNALPVSDLTHRPQRSQQ